MTKSRSILPWLPLILSLSCLAASGSQQGPCQLAQKALSESATRAVTTKALVKDLLTKSKGLGVPEYRTIKDCLDYLDYSVSEIRQCIQELKYMSGESKTGGSQTDFWTHMGNVKSLINGVMADQESCVEGFVDLGLNGTIEAAIRPQIAHVEQPVHNALAFIYQFGHEYSASINFITQSCSVTCYPLLCLNTLLRNAITIGQSPNRLAKTALAASLASAESTEAFVRKLTKFKGLKAAEYEIINDCFDQISHGVNQLREVVQELKHRRKRRGQGDFFCRISDLQTRVSAVIIDGNKCMNGFKSENFNTRIKDSTIGKLSNLIQVTKNALGLVNQM